nr:alkaline phosphatase family protein [Kofleriaceae bacterium]
MSPRVVTFAAVVAAACGSPSSPTSPTSPTSATAASLAGNPAAEPPRLVVLLVLDQWPEWAFDVKRAHLHAGGFDRLLSDGDWHVGEHPSAATLTAPGHTLLGTGEPPATSGILANEWWDRGTARMVHAAEGSDGAPSAIWLRVPGMADAVAASGRGGKAVSVSLKDRASILPLGHAGTPIWYEPKQAAWVSLAPVPWLDAWNRDHPVSARLHDVWTPLDAKALPALSGRADDAPGELGEKQFGPTFPHDPQTTKDPADAIFAMPLGNELVLDTATHAIDAEQLGADAVPDLLVVSLSAHDYVGHGWGHESWEMWDLEMRLDARLATFLGALDAKVGAGKWAMIVTSDHGAAPLPDPRRGGHITFQEVAASVQRVAVAELGPGQWVSAAKYPTVWLSPQALAVPVKDRDIAIRKMIYALRSFPGLEHVDRTDALAGDCDKRRGDARAICLALDPERSGEIAFFPAAGWVMEETDEPLATAHGSLHAYDRRVPLIVLPPGRTRHAPLAASDGVVVQMTEIAPLLAGWLGVTPPNKLPR